MSTLTSTSTEQRLSMSPFSRPLSTKPAGLPASAIMNHTSTSEGESLGQSSGRHPSPTEFPLMNGTQPSDQWQSVRDNNMSWGNGRGSNSGIRHGRQKSLSDAFKTIRTRRASVSANAHEIAEALKAPISVKLIVRIKSDQKLNESLIANSVCRFCV